MVGVPWRRLHFERASAAEVQLRTAVAAVLSPMSLVAATLAFWRLGADLAWASEFPVNRGPFSHWLVWMGLAIALRVGAARVERATRS